MSTIQNFSRRAFLQGMFSASAFVLCARLLPEKLWAEAEPSVDPVAATPFHPSVFLGIEPDGTVVIVASRSEMRAGLPGFLPSPMIST